LLVEDDRSLRQLYRLELELRGLAVEIAGDGIEALSIIEQQRPDLVVLDLGLPRLGGLAVAQELKAHDDTRSVPIVVVTGSPEPIDETGFVAVIRKPLSAHELAVIVEQALARPGSGKPQKQ